MVNGNTELKVVLTVTVMETNSPNNFTITASNAGGAGDFKVELKKPGECYT